jgi:O-antigen/teichoic acid export membrane protein
MTETNGSEHVESLVRRGAAWKFLSEIVTQVSRIVFAFLLARLLTPDEYGLAGLALIVASFVLVFSDLAFGAALVQRRVLSERDRSTVFWLGLGSGALLTLVGIGLAEPLALFFDQPELRGLVMATSLSFVVTALGATQRALLTREMDFRRLELRIMAATLIGGTVGVIVAFLGGGPWAIVAQHLGFIVVSTVLLWVVTAWRPRFMFSLQSVRELGGFSLKVFVNRILYVANEGTASVMIGRLLGTAALGLYSVAMNVVLVPLSRITIPVAEVLFPAFSRLQDERERIAALWLRALRLLAAITLPALLGLAIVAPDFVAVVLGDKWAEATPVIQALAIVGGFRALQGWNSSIVLGMGKAGILVWLSVASLIVTILAVIVGYPRGIVGVAVAYALLNSLIQIPYLYLAARLVGVGLRDVARALSGVLQATGLMGIAVYFARVGLVSLDTGPALRLVVLALLGTIVFAMAFRWRARPAYDDAVNQVRPHLRRFRAATSTAGVEALSGR